MSSKRVTRQMGKQKKRELELSDNEEEKPVLIRKRFKSNVFFDDKENISDAQISDNNGKVALKLKENHFSFDDKDSVDGVEPLESDTRPSYNNVLLKVKEENNISADDKENIDGVDNEVDNMQKAKEEVSCDNDLKVEIDLLKSKLSLAEYKLRKAEALNKTLNDDVMDTIKQKDEVISNLILNIEEVRKQNTKEGASYNNKTDTKFKSIINLVDQINVLQTERINFIKTQCVHESELNEMKLEHAKLKEKLLMEYISLDKYNSLKDKLNELKSHESTFKRKHENSQLNINMVSDARKEMRTKEREHFEAISKLHEENRALRKKLNVTENKYTILAFTPPKMKVEEAEDFNNSSDEKLDELKLENLELQCELRKYKGEVKKLNEHSIDVTSQNEEFKTKDKILSEEISSLKKQIRDINKDYMESKLKYENQLHTKDYELSILKESKDYQEQSQKMQSHVDEYSAKSYSKGKLLLQLKELSSSIKEFKAYKTETEQQLSEMNFFFNNFLLSFKNKLISTVEDSQQGSNLLAQKYAKEIQLRKKLHNQLVELKGNIRVFCRVRPIIKEDGENVSKVISFNNMDDSIIYVDHKNSKKKFEVDKVFQPGSTQKNIFEEVKSLIISCLDGYNICIFAYGQTGSGKTYTMEGTKEDPGINQQALKLLFQKTAELNDWNFKIFVSYVEIYNETLIDLLNDEPGKLEIKQHGKDGVHVPGLTQFKVLKLDDVNRIFSLGHSNRSVASTAMNERSSRSHSVLTITVLGSNTLTGTLVEGKLNLVDLAGSERVSKSGSEGVHLKEAQCINKSLSALGDVIHALKNQNQHIPYRNTKLTYLLQNCLSRDSKTLMMVQLSPVDKNAAESYCSLDFAQRVRSVELGNVSKTPRSVKKRLQKEI